MISYPKEVDLKSYKELINKPESFYGLDLNIKFCKKCTYSNQKPTSEVEFKHSNKTKKPTLIFGENNICNACAILEKKNKIDWADRKKKLKELCKKYKSKDGNYDCIVPGSGGKDSFYAAYQLKHEFGMKPLTVTFAPHIYTDWGWKNFQSWIKSGFDNYLFTPNGRANRLLSRLALENLFHPFQAFIMGQYNFPVRIATKLKIPLIFYGDTNAEFGSPDDFSSPVRDSKFFSSEKIDNLVISGISVKDLKEKYALDQQDLNPYLPLSSKDVNDETLNVQYLGYYLKWHPQECYYYAVEKGNFTSAPERNPGTHQKYVGLDDKMDDFHYYTTFIKFGIGRASYDCAQEIRNGEINRDEGIALAKKYDGEFPHRFSKEIFEYWSINKKDFSKAANNFEQPVMDKKYFDLLTDKFRSPHIWMYKSKKWQLRKKIWE